jgi:PAS domain S-box-containing protein
MKLLIGKKLIAAFGLAILLLLAISAVSRGSAARLLATAGWVTHTHQIVAELETMSRWVERAETAQRDFLIIGEDSYLAPYDHAIQAIDQTGGELRQLTIDNPGQQQRLDRLLALIQARREEISESIELRRQQGALVSLPEVLTGAGVATADAIHDLIGEMENEEQGLLKQRVAEANTTARWTDLLTTFGNLLALALVALSAVAIYRDILRRARAEAALRESEVRYRSLIAALNEGIVLQDRDGAIQTCNASAEQILGLSAEQMIGRQSIAPRWRTIHEDGTPFPGDQQPAAVTLRTGKPCTDVIMGIHKPDDALIWLIVNSLPIFRDGEAEPHAVVCSFGDITEHRQAVEALRAAETRFRTLVEQLPAITYIAALDQDSSTIYTSPQIETMLGFSQAEWMADHDLWRRQIYPDDYDRVMDDVALSQSSGVPKPSEYRMLTRDGKPIWFRDQAVIVHDPAGQPLFMQGIMFDITERKQAEAALKESEERFRQLAENIDQIFWMWSPDASELIYMSPAYEKVWGRTCQSVYDHPAAFLDGVHPDDRERIRAAQSDKALGTYNQEYRVLRPDGGLSWVHSQAFPIRNERGEVYRVAGITEDITERKQAEAALRTIEMRNRALLDAIPDLMFRLSRNGIYLDLRADNPDNLALPSNMILGKSVSDVLPPDLAPQVMACIEQALRTDTVQIIEYQLVLQQIARDFEARIVVCAENEVLAIVRDITERKNIERMKNEFVATVSHELRTPLTSIRGSLGLIAGGVAGELPPRARTMVDIAYKNSERLIRLINDILDIEKIESGKMIFNLQPVDLAPLLEQAIEGNRAYGQQFDVSFQIQSELAGAWVHADSDRLIQAVTNLLSNAAKFSPPGAQVLVTLARHGKVIRIAIRDQGPGVPEPFRERLFQKFAQADASDARQKGGTGLGLSITKAIVEKMGGQIDLMTAPGAGSTFFIDLPEWRGADQAAADAPVASILICEHDRNTADLLAAMLRENGFAADIAPAAEEAKQRLAAGVYTALVLDRMRAEQEGLALIGYLRDQEATRSLPIVVISAVAESSDQDSNCARLAPNGLIDQPIEADRLIDALKRLGSQAVGRPRILHVEDENDIRRVVAAILRDVADVVPAATLHEARRKLSAESFDLIILDLELPDGSGLRLLHDLNGATANPAPVVIFSVREASQATIPSVAATLVKSQASNQQLLKTVAALIRRSEPRDRGGD